MSHLCADNSGALKGEVVRVTLRRLKSGRIAHNTRIEFDPGQWARSVVVTGSVPGEDWRNVLLGALVRNGYDVPGLPEPRWTKDSA